MRLAPRRLGVLLAGALVVAGCLAPHNLPLVNVWAVNTGTEDRVIVLATTPDGAPADSAFLIPADGFPRSTPGATLESGPSAMLSIRVYDLDCTLLDSGEVRVGSYLITLGTAETTIAELARSMEPTGAELAAPAPVRCTETVVVDHQRLEP
jgi:hypothetical protein